MNNPQKTIAALSLCKKAGKLVTGFDAVCESVYKGKAFLVLLASDVSQGTARRMRRNSADLVACRAMPATQDQLTAITRRRVGVYAVTDQHLANLCQSTLEQEETE